MGHEPSWWRRSCWVLLLCVIPGFVSLPMMVFLWTSNLMRALACLAQRAHVAFPFQICFLTCETHASKPQREDKPGRIKLPANLAGVELAICEYADKGSEYESTLPALMTMHLQPLQQSGRCGLACVYSLLTECGSSLCVLSTH